MGCFDRQLYWEVKRGPPCSPDSRGCPGVGHTVAGWFGGSPGHSGDHQGVEGPLLGESVSGGRKPTLKRVASNTNMFFILLVRGNTHTPLYPKADPFCLLTGVSNRSTTTQLQLETEAASRKGEAQGDCIGCAGLEPARLGPELHHSSPSGKALLLRESSGSSSVLSSACSPLASSFAPSLWRETGRPGYLP